MGVAGFRQREKAVCSGTWQYLALPAQGAPGRKLKDRA